MKPDDEYWRARQRADDRLTWTIVTAGLALAVLFFAAAEFLGR
jgi:hypothetical protein